MSVFPRPPDPITKAHLFIGEPIVEFGPKLASGAFSPLRSLGIMDGAEIQKTIELATLRNAASGVSRLEREIVRLFEGRLALTVFNFTEENMQLFMAAKAITPVTAGTVAVVNEEFQLTGDDRDFVNLRNMLIAEPLTGLDCQTVTLEAVGIGQGGTFGQTLGDFSLDFPIKVIGDVPTTLGKIQYFHNGVSITDLIPAKTLVGGNPPVPIANQIGINTGAVANSGKIIYFAGEAPTAGVVITVTYTPSFSQTAGDFVANTDYFQDPIPGRVRVKFGLKLKGGEKLLADYNYTAIDHDDINPFTQLSGFNGKARISHLPDVGINFVWDIPDVTVRITDDAFAWNRDDFATGALSMVINDAGGTAPFGTMSMYEETP
jgi:hypothetical protein